MQGESQPRNAAHRKDKLPIQNEARPKIPTSIARLGRLDDAVVLALGAVVLEHILHVFGAHERVVHRDDLDVGVLHRLTHDEAADSAEAVDSDADGHGVWRGWSFEEWERKLLLLDTREIDTTSL